MYVFKLDLCFSLSENRLLHIAFAGTAASSPAIRAVDTPDIDPIALEHHENAPSAQHPSLVPGIANNPLARPPPAEIPELHLDPSIPIPVYRLPTKPFLVQPLPKIPAGFAPIIPLDRTRAPVRKWRRALRAIRGIAGGQWVVPTWVGDKESTWATVTGRAINEDGPNMNGSGGALNGSVSVGGGVGRGRGSASLANSPAVSIPKLPPVPGVPVPIGSRSTPVGSISAPPMKSRLSGPHLQGDGTPTPGVGTSTNASSRSTSVDAPPFIGESMSAVRAPSKMRHILSAEDQDQDGDEEVLEVDAPVT